jgi:ABC-type nitrate/sulfonate/bicarbonate transport system substrate-binding protein
MLSAFRTLLVAASALPIVLSGAVHAQNLVIGAAGNVGGLTVFVAQEKGFFARNGVDVKVEIRDTGPELSKGLRAGEFDFAPAALTNLPAALERGLDVRGIVGYTGGSYLKSTDDEMMAIIVAPNSGITTLQDLKGRRVGITFGATPDTYLQEVLKDAGIDIRDLNRVNASPPSLTSVLDTGGVDAIVAWDPYSLRTLDKVAGARVIKRGGDHICFCATLHGTPERVYRNEAATQGLVDAMSEAAAYVRNKANIEDVAEIGSRFANMSKDEIVRSIDNWTYDPRIGPNTAKAFTASVQQLIEQKKMKSPYDPAKYLEPKFVESTMQRHPEWFADLKG